MTAVIADPVELRQRGFEALVSVLGWLNAVRFIQQYERTPYDYTKDRERLLPEWDAAELVRRARELTRQPAT